MRGAWLCKVITLSCPVSFADKMRHNCKLLSVVFVKVSFVNKCNMERINVNPVKNVF